MHLKISIIILLVLCLFAGTAHAQTYTVVSPGGHSAQDVINEALKKAADNPGSTVYLSSENGPFVVDGPSKIGSYTRLTGDSDAVMQVWEGSPQWYTGNNGTVMPMDGVILTNVIIEGFSIDGNCDKLPPWHANYGNGDHNAERLIFLRGYSNQKTGFMSNITIRNMKIYDAFCDGIHCSFARNVYCYDNVISNCQHEGIFFTCVVDAIVKGNKIAGITSDCFRTDNGVNNLITNNYFYSYTGDNNNGATKGRHQGVQVADKGYSHGGGVTAGHELPLKTTNIEICYNVFSGAKRMNFWIDSTGKGTKNVYVHDNTIIDGETLETKGIPVEINGEIVIDYNYAENISYENPPSVEMSEKVFDNIFDIMYQDFQVQADKNSTVILPEGVTEPPSNLTAKVTQYETQTLVYVPLDGLTHVTVQADENKSTYTGMLGEKSGNSIIYTNVSIWDGLHTGDAFYFNGTPKDIIITCYTAKGSFEPVITTELIEKSDSIFSLWIFVYLFITITFLGALILIIWILLKKW